MFIHRIFSMNTGFLSTIILVAFFLVPVNENPAIINRISHFQGIEVNRKKTKTKGKEATKEC